MYADPVFMLIGKQAIETQRSMMGFKSDYSDERNDRSK